MHRIDDNGIEIVFLIPDEVIYTLLNKNAFVSHQYDTAKGKVHVIITEDISSREAVLSKYGDEEYGLYMLLRLSKDDILALKDDTPGFNYSEDIQINNDLAVTVTVNLINEKHWKKRRKIKKRYI